MKLSVSLTLDPDVFPDGSMMVKSLVLTPQTAWIGWHQHSGSWKVYHLKQSYPKKNEQWKSPSNAVTSSGDMTRRVE